MNKPGREEVTDFSDEELLGISDLRLGTVEEALELAHEALANPGSFILKALHRAGNQAFAAALSREAGLFQPAGANGSGAEQPRASPALLEQDAVDRRWGLILLVQVQILEEAGQIAAAQAVRREWQKNFAGYSAANRVFEGWSGDIIRLKEYASRVLRPQSERSKGRRKGLSVRQDRKDHTLPIAQEMMKRELLKPGVTAREAAEQVHYKLAARSFSDPRVKVWSARTIQAKIPLHTLRKGR